MSKINDDLWAKENNYTLHRDSCPDCIKRWERGEEKYCSMGHAYEVSNLRKAKHYLSLEDKLLDAINEEIMSKDEAREIIRTIEDRYY